MIVGSFVPFGGEKRNTQGCQNTYTSLLQNGLELEDQMLMVVLPVLLLSPGSLGLCCSLASAFLTFWSSSAIQKKSYAPSHRGRLESVICLWEVHYHLPSSWRTAAWAQGDQQGKLYPVP